MEGKKSLHVKAVHSLEQEGDWMHKALACTEALMPLIQSCVYRKFMRTVIFSLSFHWFIPGATGLSALCLPIGSSVLCSGRCPALLSSPSDTGCWVAMGQVRHAEGLHLGWKVCREGSVSVRKRCAPWDGTSFAGFLVCTAHCTRNSGVQAGRLS